MRAYAANMASEKDDPSSRDVHDANLIRIRAAAILIQYEGSAIYRCGRRYVGTARGIAIYRFDSGLDAIAYRYRRHAVSFMST